MSLLVAAAEDGEVWMVGTQFSGVEDAGDVWTGVQPILRGKGSSLIGYAGDPNLGPPLIHKASLLPAGAPVFDFLLRAHKTYPKVSFGYALVVQGTPHLFAVREGKIHETPGFAMGSPGQAEALRNSFEELQQTKSIFSRWKSLPNPTKTERRGNADIHNTIEWTPAKNFTR